VPVNDEALSGLVSESSGLFRSSWLGSSVDGVQVSVLPDTNSLQVSHSVRGLLAPNFIHVLVCAHFRSNLDITIERKLKGSASVKIQS